MSSPGSRSGMNRPPSRPDEEFVPEPLRERLLERASEIDAREARVSDLRAAATEAGISQRAFDAALEEMRLTRELRAEKRKRTRGMRLLLMFLGSAGLTILVGTYIIPRTIARPTYSAPSAPAATSSFSYEEYSLGCLTSEQARSIASLYLTEPANTLSYSKATGRLGITATAEQHRKVKSTLESACAVRSPEPSKAP